MPNNAATLDSRGFVFLKMTHFDAAVSDYDAALAAQSEARLGALWARRGEIEERGRWRRRADIAAAKAIQADIAEEYARYGVEEQR